MDNVSEGDVVSIAVKITSKAGKELNNTGTVIMIANSRVMVLLPSGDLWYGNSNCIYLAQEDVQ